VRYALKTPYRDGTTHLVFEPLEIIGSIEEPQVVARILSHVQRTAQPPDPAELPLGARARRRQAMAQHQPGEGNRGTRDGVRIAYPRTVFRLPPHLWGHHGSSQSGGLVRLCVQDSVQ